MKPRIALTIPAHLVVAPRRGAWIETLVRIAVKSFI